jgi:hypothetical protein
MIGKIGRKKNRGNLCDATRKYFSTYTMKKGVVSKNSSPVRTSTYKK